MKHERMPSKWRLKKTLARRMSFRPIEAEDVRFAWAAYKKGAFSSLLKTDLPADEFDVGFQAIVTTRYHGAWTLFADTRRGNMPVGMVLAFYPHADPALAPFMIVADIVWFPWASARNRIETAVYFFCTLRSSTPMLVCGRNDLDKRFFETICAHGVMRRTGTTFNVVKGEPIPIFETRLAS
jgi:hypothetical protein